MKRCPQCGKDWPVEGNFCPLDGSPLEPDPAQAPAAEAPTEKSPAPLADPDAEIEETLGDVGWDEPGEEPPASADGKREFSETQWFMVGESPDELVEVKTGQDLATLDDKYRRDSSIPDEVRDKYSLRKDPGHRKGKKGKK